MGKVLLAEKHPFRSQRGVVLAIGPLAGLSVSLKIGKHLLLGLPSLAISTLSSTQNLLILAYRS